MSTNKLRIEGRRSPLGLDVPQPRFSWTAPGMQPVALYRESDASPLWTTRAEYQCRYQGPKLEAKTRYRISVGNDVDWFETGLLSETWNAKWVEPEQQDALEEPERPPFGGPPSTPGENLKRLRPAQYLRRNFHVKPGLVRARLYATSVGCYRASVNGQWISKQRLTPEVTTFPFLQWYQSYDLTALLQPGENALGAILTDGWHIGRVGLTGISCQYDHRLAFLAQLELHYDDGSCETIGTDTLWRSHTGALDYSDLFIGERYDARKAPTGFDRPDFNDTSWTPVYPVERPTHQLCGQYIDPLSVTQERPAQWQTTPEGDCIADFGQVIAGVVRLRVRGSAGAMVTLEHTETLDAAGNFFRNIQGANKEQTDVYICSDTGEECYEPIGTAHGFRYVRVRPDPGVEILELTALVYGTPMDETAEFHCSDARLNQLWQNVLWSQRGNMLSIPTDCPQRERSGFTGDMEIFIGSACWNMDLRNFADSWLRNVRLDQSERGEITIISPNFPCIEQMQRGMSGTNCSSGWGDAIAIVPWTLYLRYGDPTILAENYDAMCKWIDFVSSWARTGEPYAAPDAPSRPDHQQYLWNTGFHFGDWLAPQNGGGNPFGAAEATKGPLGTAYYANTVAIAAQAAHVLGFRADALRYEELHRKICDAYTQEYYLGAGHLDSDYQGVYVTALAFGLLPKTEQDATAQTLCHMIEVNGWRLGTGFLSIAHLMDALCSSGHADVAYKLLYQTDCPSWLYEVEHGATTVWETWDGIQPDGSITPMSMNHYSYGCVIDWMMRHLAGIRPIAPGFAAVDIVPGLDSGLTELSARYDSVRGSIAVAWNRTQITVTIPEGIAATLRLPGRESIALPAGKSVWTLE